MNPLGKGWRVVDALYIPGDEVIETSIAGTVAVHYKGPSELTLKGNDDDINVLEATIRKRMQKDRDDNSEEHSAEIVEAAEARISDIEIQLAQANALLEKQRKTKRDIYAVLKIIEDEIAACALAGEDVSTDSALGTIKYYLDQIPSADLIMQQNNAEVWREAYWQGVDDAKQAEETGWEHQPHRINPYDQGYA